MEKNLHLTTPIKIKPSDILRMPIGNKNIRGLTIYE